MNYTTRKTYRIDWSAAFKTLLDVAFGMFMGCALAVLFFLGIPEAKAFNLIGAYAAMGAENKPVKMERKKRDKPKQVITPQTGNEQCVGGKVTWADGTISDCKELRAGI